LAVYLDTSVVMSMFIVDAHTQVARTWLARNAKPLEISDWTAAEFTSAAAVVARSAISPGLRASAEQAFDTWLVQRGGALAVTSADIRQARVLISSTRQPLRASNAVHLAVVQRIGDSLATFDLGMSRAAVDLGIPVEDLSPHP
jgi:predicted nucleic acid-binding protein